MARTAVFLVHEGGFGFLDSARGDYDTWIGLVRRLLQESATVKVVSSWYEAVTEINDGPGAENSVVVFSTRGMFSTAKVLKQEYPNLKVALLTADPYELSVEHSGVLVISKTDFDRDAVKEAMLA